MSVQVVMEALVRALPVAALVGDRVYPLALPPSPTLSLPAITLQRISTVRLDSQDGPAGLARPRVQVNAWARTYAQADELANAVRVCLDGLRNAGTGGGIIQGTFVAEDRDIYDSELKLHGRSADYLVWHEEE